MKMLYILTMVMVTGEYKFVNVYTYNMYFIACELYLTKGNMGKGNVRYKDVLLG